MRLRNLVFVITPVLAMGLVAAPAGAESVRHSSGAIHQRVDPTPGAADTISWSSCKSFALRQWGAECAKVAVPLDYGDPDGKMIKIAVSRVRHRSSAAKYQGAMLVNPGGPGASGLSMATIGAYFPNSIAAAYDWIGFDPRGIGRSKPVIRCQRDYFSFNRPDYYPRPKSVRKAWQARSEKYAQRCRKNGPILEHVTTVDSARDMESIRRALGVDTINFYGFSYGTYLGQVYSTLYPQRVRRLVLDSNVNPKRVFYRANLDQDVSFQKVFELWFDWIARYDSTFGLGTTGAEVNRRFTAIQASLADKPAGGKIGPAEWIDVYQTAAYGTYTWIDLASLFSRFARTGKAKPLIREFKSGGDFGDDNSFAVYNAVQCTDAPWPTRWRRWAKDNWATYAKAPLETWANAWFNAPCLYWPAAAGPRFAVKGREAPPALLISGKLDAATPYQGSKTVRRLFPSSRLVAIKSEPSHATSLDGNPCVSNVLNDYLSSGKLPKRRNGSKADVTCKPLPLPQPGTRKRSGIGRPEALELS